MDSGVVLELSSRALYGDAEWTVGWFWSLVVGSIRYGGTKWMVGWFWCLAVGLYTGILSA